MRVPRFFIDTSGNPLSEGTSTLLEDKDLSNQIVNVLRLNSGDSIDLLDGSGQVFRCVISSISKSKIDLNVKSSKSIEGGSPIRITIALPLIKNQRFDWAVEKLTELGVCRIQPTLNTRSVIKIPADEKSGKISRWQRIAKEAAQQCERPDLPIIEAPLPFEKALRQWRDDTKSLPAEENMSLFCLERSDHMLKDFLLAENRDIRQAMIVIGPEGGFTDEEVRLAHEMQFTIVSLGRRILRSETAALHAVTLLGTILDI